ncbi:hypothetical protein CJI58_005555 [Bifidobacteriaceae bacterium NR047]|nr:hypothetical protein [Bifidobacteriaceae bacterium NR047]
MLNKKAIAAFAAGATLLSGMALAAPAFVSAPAFAETHAAGKTDAQIKEAYDKAVSDYNDALAAKQAADSAKTAAYAVEGVSGVLTSDLKKQTADGNTTANYTITEESGVVTRVEAKQGGSADVATACMTYISKAADAKKANDTLNEKKTARDTAETAWENTNTYKQPGALKKLDDPKTKVDEAKKAVDKAFPAYVKAYNDYKAAAKAAKKAARAVSDFEDSTPDDQKGTNAYKLKLRALNKAEKKAETTAKTALAALKKAANAFTGFDEANNAAYSVLAPQSESAVAKYRDAVAAYKTAYDAAKALDADMSAYADPTDLKLDPSDYSVALANAGAGTGEEGKGGEGEGGSGEHHDKNKGKITPEEAKALAEFAVKYMKDAKSDPKTVASLKAALAKVTAAKKAKDAKALVAALKELKALVEPLMKKSPVDTGKALESIFGSDVLYTKYKGLAVDLIKLGVTNIGAYDGLLNQLEFGLSRFGWDNVVKNFPEHGPKNNCDFLAWLRRHLTKAVKHYGHVEAAVKDIQAELNEDMKDAQARHDWDAVKVIDQKIALANGLREVAHHNLTRAKALLNSANDHAKDLSCDTAAKEVRAAMDKEPNSPFKKSGQKHDSQKPNGQNGQKPNGGAASHQLGKTGATVALVAVAASVLAGMGAALRKIRH